MKRKFENGIQFNNGNINLHFTAADMDMINDENLPHCDDFWVLNECLYWMDISLTGEENYYYNDQSWIAYSFNNGCEYEIYSSDLKKLLEGKSIKLYARKPSEETLLRMEVA